MPLVSINKTLNFDDPRRVVLCEFEGDSNVRSDVRSALLEFDDDSVDLLHVGVESLESPEDGLETKEDLRKNGTRRGKSARRSFRSGQLQETHPIGNKGLVRDPVRLGFLLHMISRPHEEIPQRFAVVPREPVLLPSIERLLHPLDEPLAQKRFEAVELGRRTPTSLFDRPADSLGAVFEDVVKRG